jgi:translation elongation factor P/translation initiation factor 5A
MKRIFKMAAFMLAFGALTAGFTACGDDDKKDESGNVVTPDVDEVIDATNFKIKANANGTVTFVGDVASNAKIKTFQLLYSDGSVAYDFLESNEQVKEKNKVIDENGKVTKEKVFNVTGINSGEINVDVFTLSIKTRKAKTEAKLGEILDYTIGASKSEAGSYLSIINNKQMTFDLAKTEASEVIAESSADGYSVTGLKPASEAKDKGVAGLAGKVALFQGGAVATSVKENGVIITQSGCICKINSFEQVKNASGEATGDVTVKAVTIKSVSGLTVEVPSDLNYVK